MSAAIETDDPPRALALLAREASPACITWPSYRSGSPGVLKAILGVMRRVKEIRKEGWNKEGRYAFLYFGDVLAALQDAMVAEGLVVAQREVDRKIISKILAIKYEFDAYHADSGEAIFNIASHTGACRFEFKSGTTDDKSFSKAMVSAEKYGLLALFKIPPDDHNTERTSDGDPDAQGLNDDEPSSDAGRREREPERDDRPRDDERRRDPGEERSASRGGHADGPPDERFGPAPDENGFGEPTTGSSRSNGRVGNGEAPGFRDSVIEFKRKLEAARSEDDACEVWRDEAPLVREMADSTYEFIRSGYFSRWGIYPPTV